MCHHYSQSVWQTTVTFNDNIARRFWKYWHITNQWCNYISNYSQPSHNWLCVRSKQSSERDWCSAERGGWRLWWILLLLLSASRNTAWSGYKNNTAHPFYTWNCVYTVRVDKECSSSSKSKESESRALFIPVYWVKDSVQFLKQFRRYISNYSDITIKVHLCTMLHGIITPSIH